MRLINVHTLELEEFWGRRLPAYCIASHTWGDEEMSFQEWKARASIPPNAGFRKIVKMAWLAKLFDLDYVWIDTICIDKTSSTELSEAINSMFNWYAAAEWCFVYFEDVESDGPPVVSRRVSDYVSESLQHARWFTRGWTLQELIAPTDLVFLSQDWQIIGYLSKASMWDKRPEDKLERYFHISMEHLSLIEERTRSDVSRVSGIDMEVLQYSDEYKKRSIAVRMYWASRRSTTRVEDMAYCLLGLFGINMPLLYGEGAAAFQRLQEEIMKISVDQSIFAWTTDRGEHRHRQRISLMAPWPSAFTNKSIIRTMTLGRSPIDSVYTLTNFGLTIQLPLLVSVGHKQYIAVLECTNDSHSDLTSESPYRLCILLRKSSYERTYSRITSHNSLVALRIDKFLPTQRLYFSRFDDHSEIPWCLWCNKDDYYYLTIFVATNKSASYIASLNPGNDLDFCHLCDRIRFPRPLISRLSTRLSDSIVFEDCKTTTIRRTRLILNLQVEFNRSRDILCYKFMYDKPTFLNFIQIPGAKTLYGQGEVALADRESQIFLDI